MVKLRLLKRRRPILRKSNKESNRKLRKRMRGKIIHLSRKLSKVTQMLNSLMKLTRMLMSHNSFLRIYHQLKMSSTTLWTTLSLIRNLILQGHSMEHSVTKLTDLVDRVEITQVTQLEAQGQVPKPPDSIASPQVAWQIEREQEEEAPLI